MSFASILAKSKLASTAMGAIVGGVAGEEMGLFGPSEAEASPLGPAFKLATKAGMKRLAKHPLATSNEELLIGKEYAGKIIKGVSKGPRDSRLIVLDDDTAVPVSTSEVHDLKRKYGSHKYEDKFATQTTETSQLVQALKSLDTHLSKASLLPQNREQTLRHWKAFRDQLKGMNQEPPDLTLVQYKGKYIQILSTYVPILQEAGLPGFKVIQRLR